VRLSTPFMLLIIVSVLFISFSFIPLVYGPGTYHIEKQWIKIWINKNGTIDLFYNLTFACDTGTFSWIRIGQPNKDFVIWSCVDQFNRSLTTTKIVDDWSGVKIDFKDVLQAGQEITVFLLTHVDRMIWEDEMNPGNVSMLFTACWWEVSVVNLRIAVVLPENVKEDEILSGEILWNNLYSEDERWVAYWERSLPPNEQFQIGVSFPQKYVDKWYTKGPYADFTWSPSSLHLNETVTFDASASTPNGGVIVGFAWDFGDGNITTVADFIVCHTYVSEGKYTVILNVTDNRGLWSIHSKIIDILPPPGPWDWLGGVFASLVVPVFALSIIAVAAVVVFKSLRRFPYSSPSFAMEALGVRKGLMAVEAATLLDVDPRRILTMILFGLMRKGAVNIVETKPKLRLQVVGTAGLRYYEDWFIDAIAFESRVGTLSDKRLASLILKLRREVNNKVRFYCRADTIKYYEKVVEKAWNQVREAGTPEVKAGVFNEELEWLMMAPRFRSRVERVFGRGEEVPVGSSWWLPYWTTHYAPSRFQGVEGKPLTAQSLPGVQFANAAVTTIESTVGRIVANVEAFSKILTFATPSVEARASSSPVSRGGCVCACASCACACACASCACACASGGAG